MEESKSTTQKVGEAILEVLSKEEAPIAPATLREKIEKKFEGTSPGFTFSKWQFYNSIKFLKDKNKIVGTGARRAGMLEIARV